MIPGFQSIYDKEVENENMPKFRTPRAEAGFILIYPRLGEQRVPNENLKDVEFIWHLLDGKIFFISASYTKFDPPNLKFFVRQVAEKTNLPIQGWSFRDGNYAILRCVGFQIDVWTGKYAKNPGYEDYPSVTITDINASAELEKRVSEITRRKKEDELAKLRHEKEKKTIFKP